MKSYVWLLSVMVLAASSCSSERTAGIQIYNQDESITIKDVTIGGVLFHKNNTSDTSLPAKSEGDLKQVPYGTQTVSFKKSSGSGDEAAQQAIEIKECPGMLQTVTYLSTQQPEWQISDCIPTL